MQFRPSLEVCRILVSEDIETGISEIVKEIIFVFLRIFLGSSFFSVTLDLSKNFLDGQLPAAIGNLSTLKEMKLNDNLLQGGIPVSFGNLVSLETMKLEGNRLEDRVADEICSLREDSLDVFVVDCPIEVKGDSGVEIFGVVCSVPQCCTSCVDQ